MVELDAAVGRLQAENAGAVNPHLYQPIDLSLHEKLPHLQMHS